MLDQIRDTIRAYGAWLATEIGTRHPVTTRKADARHALMVAWSLPPLFSGGTPRPCSFLRHAGEFGWRVTALGGPMPTNPSPAGLAAMAALPPGLNILRSTRPDLRPSHRLFDRLVDIDGSLLDAIALYRAGLAGLRDDPPAVVFASGPPFCVFVAGLFLARAFGARLVLDYRDEWTLNPFDYVEPGRLDHWWERRCLRAADKVVYVSDAFLEAHHTAFPSLDCRDGVVIPNGWETEPAPDAGVTCQGGETVRIGYVGTLAKFTPTGPFLAAINEIVAAKSDFAETVRVTLVGPKSVDEEANIAAFPHPAMIESIGLLPKEKADAMMRDFDALLLITTPAYKRYLTSKLYEYIAARVPVLVFGHRGEASDLVERIGAGLFVAEGDPRGLFNAIEKLRSGRFVIDTQAVDAWLAAHHRRPLAQRLFSLLDEVAGRPTAPGRAG